MAFTISSILRVTQAYCLQLCDKQTLDYGICYYATDFPPLPQANQFREVVVDDDVALAMVYEQAEAWFAECKLTCHRWAPAYGQPIDRLAAFLHEKGFARQTYHAMQLTQWGALDVPENVRIIPARAMRKAFREMVLHEPDSEHSGDPALHVQATESRMDDPAYDAFIAMMDHEAIGRCSLYQVGDIACVMDFDVADIPDASVVEPALLTHVLTLAKRLALRTICTQLEVNSPKIELLKRAGFEVQGEFVEFHRPAQA